MHKRTEEDGEFSVVGVAITPGLEFPQTQGGFQGASPPAPLGHGQVLAFRGLATEFII